MLCIICCGSVAVIIIEDGIMLGVKVGLQKFEEPR
jgi:hypothetical protein